jgi:hypothetical protein
MQRPGVLLSNKSAHYQKKSREFSGRRARDSFPVQPVEGAGDLLLDTRVPIHGDTRPNGDTVEDSSTVRPVEGELKDAGTSSDGPIPLLSSSISTLAARFHGEGGGECGGGGVVRGGESRDEEIRLGTREGEKATDGGHGTRSSERRRTTTTPSDSVPEMGVRLEEQLVRFNSRIDPLRSTPLLRFRKFQQRPRWLVYELWRWKRICRF